MSLPSANEPRVEPAGADERRPVELIAEILAARRPLSDARRAFSPRVRMHADHHAMWGRAEAWMRWVDFMRREGRLGGLVGTFEGIERLPDGTLQAWGRWSGTLEGELVRSERASARYRVQEGRIVEMWSVRSNYTLILGEGFDSSLGFWSVIGRFALFSLSWSGP